MCIFNCLVLFEYICSLLLLYYYYVCLILLDFVFPLFSFLKYNPPWCSILLEKVHLEKLKNSQIQGQGELYLRKIRGNKEAKTSIITTTQMIMPRTVIIILISLEISKNYISLRKNEQMINREKQTAKKWIKIKNQQMQICVYIYKLSLKKHALYLKMKRRRIYICEKNTMKKHNKCQIWKG